MEFPGDIVANIIEQRLNLSGNSSSPTTAATVLSDESKDQTLQQINHILSYGLSINIYIILTNDKCQTSPTLSNNECKNFLPFECWNIQRLTENEVKTNALTPPPLLSIFLKNAIRSQLHFSPINSWLSQNGKKFPDGVKCSYRIAANNHNSLKLPDGQIERHTFPICKFETSTPDRGEFLAVNVEWIRLSKFPELDACNCMPSIPSNEWVLPTDGLPNSTEDDDECFTSSSSPSFPSSPNDHPALAKTISMENEVQVLTDFLSTSTIQQQQPISSDKRKRYKRKSTSKDQKEANVDDDDDEDNEETKDAQEPSISQQQRRRRRSRRCTTASTISDVTPLPSTPLTTEFLRPRACKSFSGVSTTAFNPRTRLPLNSSPAPLKRTPMSLASKLRAKFTCDGDSSSSDSEYIGSKNSTIYGSSQSNNALLCNFEESALNGRLEPISSIDGFKLQLAVSGNFSIPHTVIPVTTYFFDVSDDNAPSLYLGHCSFKNSPFGRKAIHIPKKCIVQATLFNPQGSVVRIFIVRIDVSDIPPRSRTFIRQRTCATPVDNDGLILKPISSTTTSTNSTNSNINNNIKNSFLRYLINLRLATDRAGKLYLHTDIRLLFSNNSTNFDAMNLIAANTTTTTTNNNNTVKTSKRGTLLLHHQNSEYHQPQHETGRVVSDDEEDTNNGITYELMTTTEMPQKPKYSPIK